MTNAVGLVLGLVAATGAALAGAVYIVSWVRRVVRTADRIEALMVPTAEHVGRELTPNSGSSMKDQQAQIPRDVARIERKVERLGEQLALVRETLRVTRDELEQRLTEKGSDT